MTRAELCLGNGCFVFQRQICNIKILAGGGENWRGATRLSSGPNAPFDFYLSN